MVDAALRDRITIMIDPRWRYRQLWSNPLGATLNRIVYVDWDSGINETAAPSYADTSVLGRGEMFKSYVSTASREVQMTFKFRVQGAGREAIYDEVIYPARFIDQLKYPIYDSGAGLQYPPPPVVLSIGSLLQIRALLTTADVRWIAPFEPEDLLPHGADVQATFTVVRESNNDTGYPRDAARTGAWR
tara:strand:+ start:34 stop:597 length:564 start_codon:yes stop_codon:yes gene_type:complete